MKDVDKYENESEKMNEVRQELEKLRNDLLFYQDENDRLKNNINTLKGKQNVFYLKIFFGFVLILLRIGLFSGIFKFRVRKSVS